MRALDTSEELARGRESYSSSAWRTSYDSFMRADGLAPLAAEDLERLDVPLLVEEPQHEVSARLPRVEPDVHAWIAPSTTMTMDDFVGPDVPPSSSGLPYVKGGICEVGAGVTRSR